MEYNDKIIKRWILESLKSKITFLLSSLLENYQNQIYFIYEILKRTWNIIENWIAIIDLDSKITI